LMHEVGLRILIRKVQMIGAQHDKALIPIYSYFKDHYNRIFFKCIKSKLEVDKLFAQHKYFLYCNKCMTFTISEFNNVRCEKCDVIMAYAGPMWIGSLYDKQLAEKIFKSNKHVENERFLDVIMQESVLDDPKFIGFYEIHELCKYYKKVIPNFEILIPKIANMGYKVSRTHFTPLGIKTNMPIDELLRVIELSTKDVNIKNHKPK
jgi:tRNA (guanine26-N2/guanine27-N2)-dimethyltransferase